MNFIHPNIFYTRLKTHHKFLYLHFIKHFSIKNVAIGIAYFFVIFIISAFNAICRLIDELLFPNYRNIEIKSPVFIISNPRSGTTFLHRLMCLDDEKFVYNLLYHTTFHSIIFYRIVQVISGIDNKIGKPLHRILDWINDTMFKGWDEIHKTGFNKSEEDEGWHFISGISASIGLVTPFLKEFNELYIPDNLPENEKDNIKKYYKASIQRWMYALGSDKIFLSKTVMSSGRLEMLHDLFPDVKIIYLIRHPYQAIPSFTSMFAEPWGTLYPKLSSNSDEYREWGEVGIQYYKYFNIEKSKFNKENFITIHYTDLISNPMSTVLKIYEQLNLEITDKFVKKLDEETHKQRKYTSKHTYSLKEYGFEKEHIYKELQFIFEEFGFEK